MEAPQPVRHPCVSSSPHPSRSIADHHTPFTQTGYICIGCMFNFEYVHCVLHCLIHSETALGFYSHFGFLNFPPLHQFEEVGIKNCEHPFFLLRLLLTCCQTQQGSDLVGCGPLLCPSAPRGPPSISTVLGISRMYQRITLTYMNVAGGNHVHTLKEAFASVSRNSGSSATSAGSVSFFFSFSIGNKSFFTPIMPTLAHGGGMISYNTLESRLKDDYRLV